MTETNPDPDAAANSAAEPIDFDLPCPQCSYNLRERRLGDRCPECGTRIDAASIRRTPDFLPVRYLSRITPNLRLALWAIAAAAIAEPVNTLTWYLLRWRKPDLLFVALEELRSLGWIALAFVAWSTTAGDRRIASTRSERTIRSLTRYSIVALVLADIAFPRLMDLAGWILEVPFAHEFYRSVGALRYGHGFPIETALRAILLAAAIRHAITISRRVGAPAGRFNVVAICIGTGAALISAAHAIASLFVDPYEIPSYIWYFMGRLPWVPPMDAWIAVPFLIYAVYWIVLLLAYRAARLRLLDARAESPHAEASTRGYAMRSIVADEEARAAQHEADAAPLPIEPHVIPKVRRGSRNISIAAWFACLSFAAAALVAPYAITTELAIDCILVASIGMCAAMPFWVLGTHRITARERDAEPRPLAGLARVAVRIATPTLAGLITLTIIMAGVDRPATYASGGVLATLMALNWSLLILLLIAFPIHIGAVTKRTPGIELPRPRQSVAMPLLIGLEVLFAIGNELDGHLYRDTTVSVVATMLLYLTFAIGCGFLARHTSRLARALRDERQSSPETAA